MEREGVCLKSADLGQIPIVFAGFSFNLLFMRFSSVSSLVRPCRDKFPLCFFMVPSFQAYLATEYEEKRTLKCLRSRSYPLIKGCAQINRKELQYKTVINTNKLKGGFL